MSGVPYASASSIKSDSIVIGNAHRGLDSAHPAGIGAPMIPTLLAAWESDLSRPGLLLLQLRRVPIYS